MTIAADATDVARLQSLAAVVRKPRVKVVEAKDGRAADFSVTTTLADGQGGTRLFGEAMHVVAGAKVRSLADLRGRTVSFGADGSASQAVARKAFEAAGVAVAETPLDLANALDGLVTGDIDAVVVVAPQPDARLKALASSGLHLVAWPDGAALPEGAVAASIDGASYPGLAKPGDKVAAVGVDAVLVASPKGQRQPAAKASSARWRSIRPSSPGAASACSGPTSRPRGRPPRRQQRGALTRDPRRGSPCAIHPAGILWHLLSRHEGPACAVSRHSFTLAIGILAASLAPLAARAESEMSFRLVQLSNGTEVVSARGQITDEDARPASSSFSTRIPACAPGDPSCSSIRPAGRVLASTEFGKVLRQVGAAVVVARVGAEGMTNAQVLLGLRLCPDGRQQAGHPLVEHGRIHRMFAYQAEVDPSGTMEVIHRRYDDGTMKGYLRHYSSEMGVDPGLISDAEHVSSDNLRILSKRDIRRYRLGVSR